MKDLKNSKLLEKTFDNIKEKHLNDYQNFYLGQSYTQVMPTQNVIMTSNSQELRKDHEVLKDVTFGKFKNWLDNWMKSGQSLIYVYGNMPEIGSELLS